MIFQLSTFNFQLSIFNFQFSYMTLQCIVLQKKAIFFLFFRNHPVSTLILAMAPVFLYTEKNRLIFREDYDD